MIGTRLSQYVLLERLGGGGQGVVYRARDERLQRDVAIKVLPAGALANEDDRKQFRREALHLSRLNHPNVQTIHDFATEDGTDYLVLELVSGPTLEESIRGGPLPEDDVIRLGLELAEGLDAAHAERIYHRDIKPSNLKVTGSGHLKILDFGLAKTVRSVTDDSMTQTVSAVAGTAPYMAPEQVRGTPPDARSDIYSVGALLYEMATGRRAFPQDSQPAVIAAILSSPPAPIREIRPGVSRALEAVIARCLEKDPARRYPTVRALAEDLRRVSSGGRVHGARKPIVRRVLAACAALVLAISIAVAWRAGVLRTLFPADVGERSLAVLPLANLSGDPTQEYFADGMTDELITRLSQVGALRVISRSSVMPYKHASKPLRQIAKELKVKLILEGSAVRSGDQVRVSAKLVDPFGERPLWAESYQRTMNDVLMLQGDLARSIVDRIRVRLTPNERARLAVADTVAPAALHAYLRGRFYAEQWTGDGMKMAREEFENAIRIDPTYAPAHVGLGRAYYDLAGNFLSPDVAVPRARASILRAIELDPELASAHASLGYLQAYYDWDWSGAERSIRRAIAISPGDATGHQSYGALLTSQGRFTEAEREFARARSIDPLSSALAQMSLWPLFEGRQYDRAAEIAAALVQTDPKSAPIRVVWAEALLFQGHHQRAIEEFRTCTELEPTVPFFRAWLAYAYGASGDTASARRELKRLLGWKDSYVTPYLLTVAYLGVGRREEALIWLDKAYAARSDELFFLKVDPVLDPLRSDPRFQTIMRKMKFTS